MKKLFFPLLLLIPTPAIAETPDDRARVAVAIALASEPSPTWFSYQEGRAIADRDGLPLVAFCNCDPEDVEGAVVCGGHSCANMAQGAAVIVMNTRTNMSERMAAGVGKGRIREAIRRVMTAPVRALAAVTAPRQQVIVMNAAPPMMMGYGNTVMMRSNVMRSMGYGGSSMMRMRMGGYSGGMMMRSGGIRMMARSGGACAG